MISAFVNIHDSEGKVKSSLCKAHESLGIPQTRDPKSAYFLVRCNNER